MKQRPRIYYTEAQKALMWDRWKAGDTLHEIGKLFDRPHTSILTILSATGGIRPPARRRSHLTLSLAEREEISRSLAAGESIRCVAKRLKRAASTISRELLRNGGKTCYRATKADEAAWERAHRPKTCKLACNPELAQIVAGKLQSQWSPEQIAGWLKRTYPCAKDLQVSHEAIYRTLFVQTRGALKKELLEHLRRVPGGCVAHATTRRKHPSMGVSSMQCPSASVRPAFRIGQFQATGKVICCSAMPTARLRRWSSDTRAT
jgi:IS30 family transposase